MLKEKKGFTLFEVLVVCAIITILVVLAIASYAASQRKANVNRTAQKFLADVRRAQSSSLAIKNEGGDIPCGYGITFGGGGANYKYFYNKTDCTSVGTKKYNGSSVTLTTINLPNGLTITPSTNADIFFIPPDPKTYINDSGSFSSQTYTISDGSGNSKQIIIYASGRIDNP